MKETLLHFVRVLRLPCQLVKQAHDHNMILALMRRHQTQIRSIEFIRNQGILPVRIRFLLKPIDRRDHKSILFSQGPTPSIETAAACYNARVRRGLLLEIKIDSMR